MTRILIVEDEAAIAIGLEDDLRLEGYEVEVIADGRAQPHHVLPDTGWVSCWMEGPDDAAGVIDLFRLQYERYSAKRALI